MSYFSLLWLPGMFLTCLKVLLDEWKKNAKKWTIALNHNTVAKQCICLLDLPPCLMRELLEYCLFTVMTVSVIGSFINASKLYLGIGHGFKQRCSRWQSRPTSCLHEVVVLMWKWQVIKKKNINQIITLRYIPLKTSLWVIDMPRKRKRGQAARMHCGFREDREGGMQATSSACAAGSGFPAHTPIRSFTAWVYQAFPFSFSLLIWKIKIFFKIHKIVNLFKRLSAFPSVRLLC